MIDLVLLFSFLGLFCFDSSIVIKLNENPLAFRLDSIEFFLGLYWLVIVVSVTQVRLWILPRMYGNFCRLLDFCRKLVADHSSVIFVYFNDNSSFRRRCSSFVLHNAFWDHRVCFEIVIVTRLNIASFVVRSNSLVDGEFRGEKGVEC